MATNYDINYNDERFTKVESQKSDALNELENTYSGMIDDADSYYKAQIDAAENWKNEQTKLQNEQTDHAINKIEQQKDQAHKDYLKEQSGAYVDWRKQSNEYGANAEEMAASGLQRTGYSESSQVSMYNTYQNRVATAREAYGRAVLNYDNAIKDAQLQNSSVLAEIAYEALQKQLELSLQGFQYKNTLILEKANKKTEMDQMYYERYQDVLQQINHENALAEEVRQYNESKAMEEKKLAEQIRQYNATLAEEKRQFDKEYALDQQQLQIQKSKASSGGSSKKTVTKSSSKSTGSKSSGIAGIVKSGQATQVSQYEVDTKSALGLGQGPISGSNLADQVSSGKVKATTSGNKIKFGYNSPTKDLLFSKTRL